MADARDSKSRILHWVCGFDSHLRYLLQTLAEPRLVGVFAFLVESIQRCRSCWERDLVGGTTLKLPCSTRVRFLLQSQLIDFIRIVAD